MSYMLAGGALAARRSRRAHEAPLPPLRIPRFEGLCVGQRQASPPCEKDLMTRPASRLWPVGESELHSRKTPRSRWPVAASFPSEPHGDHGRRIARRSTTKKLDRGPAVRIAQPIVSRAASSAQSRRQRSRPDWAFAAVSADAICRTAIAPGTFREILGTVAQFGLNFLLREWLVNHAAGLAIGPCPLTGTF